MNDADALDAAMSLLFQVLQDGSSPYALRAEIYRFVATETRRPFRVRVPPGMEALALSDPRFTATPDKPEDAA